MNENSEQQFEIVMRLSSPEAAEALHTFLKVEGICSKTRPTGQAHKVYEVVVQSESVKTAKRIVAKAGLTDSILRRGHKRGWH